MSNCDDAKIWCPTDMRRFAELGVHYEGNWKHLTTQTVTLDGVTLLSTNREASTSWLRGVNYTDGSFACVTVVGTEIVAIHVIPSFNSEGPACTFKEKNKIVTNEILFLDLRHDILVRKETTQEYNQNKDSGTTTLWNNYGNVVRVNTITPSDLEITESSKLYVNDELIDEVKPFLKISENPYVIALPPLGGTPQTNEEEMYYIWVEKKDEDGGYDLYYPEWVRGISPITEPFDIDNRDRHRALNPDMAGLYGRPPINGSTNSPETLTYSETDIKGSWAISPQTKTEGGTDYFKAFATNKINDFQDQAFVLNISPKDELTEEDIINLFGIPKERPWPISPL